jgi:hypothetical protein
MTVMQAELKLFKEVFTDKGGRVCVWCDAKAEVILYHPT